MKQEKDNRVNAHYSSVKDYLLLFFVLSAVNGFHMWVYLTLLDKGMIENHLQIAINLLILFIIVAAGLITASVALVRHRIWTQPIRKLSVAARKIAKGDFSVRIAPMRKDGKKDFLEVLFDDFNTMTEELASANEKLKALSVTDELTKLDNRRSFLEYVNLLWKQGHRLQLPITVLMIDVDYFKKYNDSMGHLEGDKALVSIAQCLKNQIKRETDFVARFGGEEFVCLLPFIEKDEAFDFAKTMVQGIENMKIPHPVSECSKYVTVSVGMAGTIPDDNNTFTQLLGEADKALYMAKESGRNRVVMN